MIQVGLIGAGTIGAMHAKHLAREIEGARLAVVADVHEPSARRVGV